MFPIERPGNRHPFCSVTTISSANDVKLVKPHAPSSADAYFVPERDEGHKVLRLPVGAYFGSR